jgi:hypothetical protein
MATIKRNEVFLGTEIKLSVEIEPIGSITMDDYDFIVEIYCSTKRVQTFTKAETIRVNAWNYLVLVNTSELGAGDVKCKVTAHVPDSDFDDMVRTEVACVDTGITIIKNI